MPETKTTLKLLGKEMAVTEVPITGRKDPGPVELDLEDGSIIRVAAPVTTVYRIDDQWEGDGNPLYLVKNGIAVTLVKGGDAVRKK